MQSALHSAAHIIIMVCSTALGCATLIGPNLSDYLLKCSRHEHFSIQIFPKSESWKFQLSFVRKNNTLNWENVAKFRHPFSFEICYFLKNKTFAKMLHFVFLPHFVYYVILIYKLYSILYYKTQNISWVLKTSRCQIIRNLEK